jgi:hypothetical protein
MAWVFKEVIDNINSICYSFNTYKDLQARKPCEEVPVIAIILFLPTRRFKHDFFVYLCNYEKKESNKCQNKAF